MRGRLRNRHCCELGRDFIFPIINHQSSITVNLQAAPAKKLDEENSARETMA